MHRCRLWNLDCCRNASGWAELPLIWCVYADVSRESGIWLKAKVKNYPRVCLVLAYFGRWPAWMEYFLESCRRNPEYNWLIFTDIGQLPSPCSNVQVQQITYADLKHRAESVSGLPVSLEHPYKVCDLKPLYGRIFQQELLEYDFWGYTDLDVIYGRLPEFVPAAELASCDVFTAAPRLIVGHFTLFRNSPQVSDLFLRVPNLRQILSEYECVAFDEQAFAAQIEHEAAAGLLRLKRSAIQLDDSACLREGRQRFLILRTSSGLWDVATARRLAYYHFIQTKYRQGFAVQQLQQHQWWVADQKGIRCVPGGWRGLRLCWPALLSLLTAIPSHLRAVGRMLLSAETRRRIRQLAGKGKT